jgi:hypothetical protein
VEQSPGSLGPALERSIVEVPPALIEPRSFEFTWMLRPAPPQIWISEFPLTENEPAILGCVTMIGTGATTSTMAATAMALADEVGEPSNPIRVVFRVRVMVIWITVGGSARLTPGAVVGRAMTTWSAAAPPKPLLRAKTQGVLVPR